jgi:hypothetical protein
MDFLLFLGSEFLRRMTDPSVGDEEKQSFRYELAAYLNEEQGAAVSLVNAFNRLDFDEASAFSRETVLWYLDWVTRERNDLTGYVEPRSISILWSAFNEPVVRTRAVEALVEIEGLRDVRPAGSEIINIIRLAFGVRGDEVFRDSDFPRLSLRDNEPSPDAVSVVSQVIDTLLTEQSSFALRVLGESISQMPGQYRQHFHEEIRARLSALGRARAKELLAVIGVEGEPE